jgi:glycosyltransferase involved in cell wall biosynthesis
MVWCFMYKRVDEIWVPSSFLVEVFASGGVPREKLVVVPIPIDTQFYSPLPFLPSSSSSSTASLPSQLRPLSLPNRGGFNFLSVFKWEQRKGWDVLLDAYLAEFKPEVHACTARVWTRLAVRWLTLATCTTAGQHDTLPPDLPSGQYGEGQEQLRVEGDGTRHGACQQ